MSYASNSENDQMDNENSSTSSLLGTDIEELNTHITQFFVCLFFNL